MHTISYLQSQFQTGYIIYINNIWDLKTRAFRPDLENGNDPTVNFKSTLHSFMVKEENNTNKPRSYKL